MALSGTVEPHGSTGADDAEDVGTLARRNLLRSAEEALGAVSGRGVERRAGAVESRLGDRVGAGEEVELDNLTAGDRDAIGLHRLAVLAYVDDGDIVLSLGGARNASAATRRRRATTITSTDDRGKGQKGRGEHGQLHFEFWKGLFCWGKAKKPRQKKEATVKVLSFVWRGYYRIERKEKKKKRKPGKFGRRNCVW